MAHSCWRCGGKCPNAGSFSPRYVDLVPFRPCFAGGGGGVRNFSNGLHHRLGLQQDLSSTHEGCCNETPGTITTLCTCKPRLNITNGASQTKVMVLQQDSSANHKQVTVMQEALRDNHRTVGAEGADTKGKGQDVVPMGTVRQLGPEPNPELCLKNPAMGAGSGAGPVPVQTCLPSWHRSVESDPGHSLPLLLLVEPQLLEGPRHCALRPCPALRSVAHACAWACHTPIVSSKTFRMNSVPIVWGPVSPCVRAAAMCSLQGAEAFVGQAEGVVR